MGIERQMFAITEEHYNEGTLESSTSEICIKTDALMSITRARQVKWHFLLHKFLV
jgi:hypothetical protein